LPAAPHVVCCMYCYMYLAVVPRPMPAAVASRFFLKWRNHRYEGFWNSNSASPQGLRLKGHVDPQGLHLISHARVHVSLGSV
jgi:type IV secretory pathway VirB3-like protein